MNRSLWCALLHLRSVRVVLVLSLSCIGCEGDLVQPGTSRFIHADSVWLRVEIGGQVWQPNDSSNRVLLFGLGRENNDLELIAWSTTIESGNPATPTFALVIYSLNGLGTYATRMDGPTLATYSLQGGMDTSSYRAFSGFAIITSLDTISSRTVGGHFEFLMESNRTPIDTLSIKGQFSAFWK